MHFNMSHLPLMVIFYLVTRSVNTLEVNWKFTCPPLYSLINPLNILYGGSSPMYDMVWKMHLIPTCSIDFTATL